VSVEKAKYLATIIRGLEQLEREKEEYMTEWKDRRKKLENALATGADDVLSGQAGLPLEPAPPDLPLAVAAGQPSAEAVAVAERYPS
jgi:hypothetical protein